MASKASPAPTSGKVLSEYRVLAKCDEPVKAVPLVIPAGTTFGALKVIAAAALGLSESVAAKYSYYGVAFGYDITPFGTKASGDAEVLVDSGLRDRSVLFVRAPLDIKPSVERKTKKQKEREAAGADAFDPERFAGVTPQNVFSKLSESKGDDKKKKIYFEFIDQFTADSFKEKDAFATLSVENLIAILKSDKLSVKESDVFEAALGWGKAELKRMEKDKATSTDVKMDLKTAMAKVLPFIRFPVMDMADVATKVTGSGLLSQEQVLALYTYIGMRPPAGASTAADKMPKLPESLAVFGSKSRTGSTRVPAWDGTQSFTYNLYVLSNNNRTASQNQDGTIYIIREAEPRTRGIHTIRVRCDSAGRHDNYANDAIGFANEYYPWTNATLNSSGSCFVNGTGQFYVDNSVRQSGMFTIQTGTVLTFTLDIDKKTVSVSATNGSTTSATVKQDWSNCGSGGRVYFAMCFRYRGWSFTCLE